LHREMATALLWRKSFDADRLERGMG